jgi:hypothetical protein
MVDNGYLRWPTTIPPFKESVYVIEERFSQWLESMRKDVECTLGILKGRLRLLKTGVHGVEATDKIWLRRRDYDAFDMGPSNDRENSMNIDGPDYTGDDPVPTDRRARIFRHLTRDYFR